MMAEGLVRAAVILLAVLMLYWSKVRLDCLFYSAFEFAQASLIRSALPLAARAFCAEHWFYSRFFTGHKAVLLGGYYASAAAILLCIFLHGTVLNVFGILFAAAAFGAVIYWHLSRVTCRGGERHIPYNAFAPLTEHQRRELNQQRNQLRLTRLFQRMDLFRSGMKPDISTADRQAVAEKYGRY